MQSSQSPEDFVAGGAHSPMESRSQFPDPFPFFSLPLELRNQIYRYIVISRLDCYSHPRLWRPLSVDDAISRIGYFDKDTVIPLLLTCQRIHDEATAILCGENTFAFHISGLATGPIKFLDLFTPKYIRLLRKVYLRTGFHADTDAFRPQAMYGNREHATASAPHASKLKAAHDLAVSVALVKQAWPARPKISINKRATLAYPADEVTTLLDDKGHDARPSSSYHLWKMVVTEIEVGLPKIEFMRIEWGSPSVKNMRADGTRATKP